ncbi:hypothetical protein FQA39_LY11547 [Lamprigera yunnana]|nr:hypothetical protein FQA39_LY11547 [Lamprigera yunnana]
MQVNVNLIQSNVSSYSYYLHSKVISFFVVLVPAYEVEDIAVEQTDLANYIKPVELVFAVTEGGDALNMPLAGQNSNFLTAIPPIVEKTPSNTLTAKQSNKSDFTICLQSIRK